MNNLEQEAQSLFTDIMKSEHASDLYKIVKKIRPDTNLPHLDLKEEVNNRFKDLEKRLQDKEDDVKLINRLNKERERLSNLGYSRETINNVEQLMRDEGISSHEAATALYEKRNPPIIEPKPIPKHVLKVDDEIRDVDLLKKDPDAWLDQTIDTIMSEGR